MAYLPNYKWDIFISYSHLDNTSVGKLENQKEDKRGWIHQFHQSLKRCLSQQLGHDQVCIYRDIRLLGNDSLTPSIIEACQTSALLVCITSPSYLESEWCKKEYKIFWEANQNSFIQKNQNKLRIFNVRLREVFSKSQKQNEQYKQYRKMFGDSLGYEFFDSDPDLGWSCPLPINRNRYNRQVEKLVRDICLTVDEIIPPKPNDSEPICRYSLVVDPGVIISSHEQAEVFVNQLREICNNEQRLTLIKVVKGASKLILEGPSSIFRRIDELIKRGKVLGQPSIKATALYPASLDTILLQAEKRLVISGHTLNRFVNVDKISAALKSLLHKGVQVTFVALNPNSEYARAHALYHYHELESSGPAADQYKKALEFMRQFFENLDDKSSRAGLEVLLSNYMPRFRSIVVDDNQIYLYLYMYGDDVNDYPDFIFKKDNQILSMGEDIVESEFKRIASSVSNLVSTPEIIPYIRDGRLNDHWENSHLAKWINWGPEIKYRHRITHYYYFNNAIEFDKRFGDPEELEIYVQKHLNLLSGRTLIIGCGSGKEVEYLSKQGQCSKLYGLDFCPEAVKIARDRYPKLANDFIVADFYDLEYIVDGEFDSIVANAAFVHLFERRDMSTILRHIWMKLRVGGSCFIRNLYREENGKPIDQDYVESKQRFNDPRWFVYYSRPDLVEFAKNVGFFINDEATQKIAEEDPRVKNVRDVMVKGFPHDRFEGVHWPTILLVKPDDK